MPQQEEKKIKRKKWYTVLASKEFNHIEIGEIPTSNPNSLLGRNVSISLANLTRDIKKQNIRLTFKIKKIEDNKALTEITAYELIQTYIKRMTMAGKEKIDDSFVCETKDNIKIRLKPFLLTKNKTKRSILAALRKASKSFIIENAKKQDYSSIINSLTSFKLQSDLKKHLNKIYPLAVCHIRKLEI